MKQKKSLKKIVTDLSFLIIAAMVLGVVVGKLMGSDAKMLAPLGTLFIQLIKMLVVPLVFVSIVSGAASLGATKSAGRIGLTTLLYIFVTTFLAVGIAIAGGEIFKPGSGIDVATIRSFLPEQEYKPTNESMGFWI